MEYDIKHFVWCSLQGKNFEKTLIIFLIVLEVFRFLFYSETYLTKYDFLTNVFRIVKYYTFTHTKLLTICLCYPFNVSSHCGYVFLLIINVEFLILYRYLLKWGLLSLFMFSSPEFYSLSYSIYIIVPGEDPLHAGEKMGKDKFLNSWMTSLK